jgi:hypothetical protein
MNRFLEHHDKSIRFVYSCFDRILLNAFIQDFQRPPTIVWFFHERRQINRRLSKDFFRSLSSDYHTWVEEQARAEGYPLEERPKDVSREEQDEWIESFYRQHGSDPGIVFIVKSRENARVAISRPTTGQPHIELKPRFVWQYYFYILDDALGRMWIRVCPYFPFSARVCLNGHGWLASRMRQEGIHFRQQENAFLTCSQPERLQQLADRFSHQDIALYVGAWLADLVPYFTEQERLSYSHQLSVSQIEYCTNIVFHRRASLDRMQDRLLDLNRTIGRPDRMSIIFQRRMQSKTAARCRTRISGYQLANPVIRSSYKKTDIKQYVRNYLMLRTETISNNLEDLRIGKSIENLGRMREVMHPINDRYLDVQQDVMETYIDRDHLQKLRQPTIRGRRRTPGLKLDDERLLAVMQALVRFAPLATGGQFRTKDLHDGVAHALGKTTDTYKKTQLRYDLSKLREKGLVEKVEGTQCYRLTAEGYRICLLFLKLHQRLAAPLISGIVAPSAADVHLPAARRCKLDCLYAAVDRALNNLCSHVGLKTAA